MFKTILRRLGVARWLLVAAGLLASAVLVLRNLSAQEGGGDPAPNQENQNLCNGQPYDPNTQGCCNGTTIYTKATQCCYDKVIRSKVDTDGDGIADCCVLPTPNWAALQACPGTRKQSPSYPNTPNGCTGVSNNPCGLNGTSFLGCCNAHDIGYGTCNSVKATVDTAFLNCMTAVCNAAGNPRCSYQPNHCQWWANRYYDGVRSVDRWYRGAQVAACVCCVNGS